MVEYTGADAAIGTLAIVQALVRHLKSKGLLSDDEFQAVIQDALQHAASHPHHEAVASFIVASDLPASGD